MPANDKPTTPATKATPAKAAPKARTEDDTAADKDIRRCVVEGCDWTRTPGDKICSGHAIHYHRDGSPRQKNITDGEGQVIRTVRVKDGKEVSRVAGAVAAADTLAHPKEAAPAVETPGFKEG